MNRNSPCEHCNRVACPARCDNKDCKAWRSWFLARWEGIHNYYRKISGGAYELEA